MKKLFSMILVLSMILSMAPAVFAAETSETEQPVLEPVNQEELAAELVEAETAEAEARKEAEAEAELDPEADFRRLETELRAKDMIDRTKAEVDLFAASYDVTVKVKFPNAATEGGQMRVYLHQAAVKDEDGFVLQYPYVYVSQNVSVAEGDKSISATFSVPKGDYFVEVYTQNVQNGSYLYQEMFFNGDGTYTANEYTAEPVAISRDKTITVNLPTAERTISGKLKFSKALTEDTNFRVRLYSIDDSLDVNIYYNFAGEKGDKSVSFSVPVPASSYRVCFYNNDAGTSGYYDVTGGLSNNYDTYAYVSTYAQSVSGWEVDADLLMDFEEEEEGISYGHDINITIKLPEETTEPKEYLILLYSPEYDELWTWDNFWVESGTEELSDVFWYPEDMDFIVGYMEADNWNSISWRGPYAGARYEAESGITTQLDKAKVRTMGTEDISITVNDSKNYKLTGTLKLDSARKNTTVAYAVAEFENGERYAGRVFFDPGVTSGSYTIYVPKTESGSFDHWAAEAITESDFLLSEETRVDSKSYTLKGNASLSTITLTTPAPNVTGKLSLPSGMTAPEGGLALYFSANDSDMGVYHMAEGESSIDFSFVAALSSEEYENYISVRVMDAPANLADSQAFYVESAADMMNVSMTLQETVILSGNVVVSDAAKDPATTFRIRANDSDYNYSSDVYVSTLPGETTAAYRLKVLKGMESRVRVYVQADATGSVLSADQYLQEDGTFATSNAWVTLNKDTTANVTFVEGKTISGTISLASGLPSGYYYGQVYAQPKTGGTNYRVSYSFEGTSCTYRLAVPADYTDTWRIYCYVYTEGDSDAMTDTNLYYSEQGTVTSYSEATLISAPAENIDFLVPAARTISGSVIVPEEFEGYYFWGNVQAYSSDDNSVSSHIESDSLDYTIKVPSEYTGTYKLGLRLYADDSIPGMITGTTMYITEDGTLSTDWSQAKEFTVGENGLYQDLVVPLASTYTVTLKAPQGFSGYYDGRLYLYDLDAYSNAMQKNFEFDGSETEISLSLPSADGRYALRIYLYDGSGVVTDKHYYYNSTTETWVTDASNATALDMTAEGIEVTMPKAKTISGKLVSVTGDTIQLPENGMGFSMYQKGTNYDNWVSINYTADSEGNFTITVPSDLTGQFRLSASVNNESNCNIVDDGDYHYKSDATASVGSWVSGDDTFYFTVGEDDVTGLKIYVDTGYVMTGTVKLGTGAQLSGTDDYLGSVSVYLFPQQGNALSTYVQLKKGESSWQYTIAVPKTNTSYTLKYEFSLDSDATSNLYEDMQGQGTVTVSGPAALPDIVLMPGKHQINVTMKNPVSRSVSGDLYLELLDSEGNATDTISKYFSLPSNGSATYTAVTTPAETAVSYRLYYYAYNTQGLVSYKNVYVTADGTLTTKVDNAGIFSLTEDTAQSFTMIEQAPYVSGKIYLPDVLDDTDFQIDLSGYGYQTVYVRSDTVLKDSNGQYVPYALYSSSLDIGDTFYLQYYLNDSYYSGDVLFSGEAVYLGEDGSSCYDYYDKTFFTIPESGTFALDFTLATWNDGAEENLLQSAHGINSETGELTYTYTYPGATYLAVTFSDRTDTALVINNQTYYASSLRGRVKNIDVSQTNGTMTVKVNSTNTYSKDYGFGIVSIVPYYGAEAVEQPVITALYSANGSGESTVLEDICNGKPMYVSMAAPEGYTGTVIAAVYNAAGRMLAADISEMTFTQGYDSAELCFADAEDAAKLKIMFVDSAWAPQSVQLP